MSGHGRTAAFFDVDETLVRRKTMVGFFDFHLAGRGVAADARAAVLTELQSRARTRMQANRAYYRWYRDESVETLAATGRAWFAQAAARPDFFNPDVVAALRAHAADGAMIVLVSGSFAACLAPIAEAMGADVVLCTELLVAGGRYTGVVRRPMIGRNKGVAVRRFVSRHGLVAADCHAYGDHSSDLPMLRSVGHGVVVGDDPVLTGSAERFGWRTLPNRTMRPTP